ncbi:putative spermidine/putrescine transport system permease protein [Pseudonocardia thermophila]|jgi:ABC-type spermidine/putrescine transport system, permease component I|uniref:Putative spermidine/putrescine transport system permease protein n=1 Tax=Pseudonocardia thermophila TaxID=1848 RepID=A0A1M6ZN27_PSETH|nr:ABC transporter permease [Pseudonocardia thermophila]SHL31735.1 putative spermidine/putrescine transport system permease protein [Pseudonocardia thermophila]
MTTTAVLDVGRAAPVRAAGRTTGSRTATALLLAPAVIASLALFVYPLARIVVVSVTEPTIGLHNYAELFTDGYTLRVLTRTLLVALGVAVLDLLMAFPYAYAMTVCSPRVRAVLFTIVLIPFWTSALAKNFAWMILFQRGGLVDEFLKATLGIDYPLLGTTPAVLIAMSQVLLPFAVLPLYASLEQIDRRLVDAAQGLGATRGRAFRQVYLPLAAPGLVAAGALAFILSLGFYITPALLGSPQQTLIAQLIMARVEQVLDFAGADAIGIFLLIVTVAMALLSRWVSRRATARKEAAR